MSEGLLGLIGVAVGAGLTFAFTMLSNWQANRAEQKRIRNRVLFYLFEIHNRLSRLKEEFPIRKIFEKFLAKYPEHQIIGAQIPDKVWEIFLPPARITMQIAIAKDLKLIEAAYPTAIQDLASISPAASYYLHNLNLPLERLESVTQTMGDQLYNVFSPEGIEIMKNLQQEALTPSVVKNAMKNIEETAMELTKGWMNKKIHQQAATIFERNNEIDLHEVDPMIFEAMNQYFILLGNVDLTSFGPHILAKNPYEEE